MGSFGYSAVIGPYSRPFITSCLLPLFEKDMVQQPFIWKSSLICKTVNGQLTYFHIKVVHLDWSGQ